MTYGAFTTRDFAERDLPIFLRGEQPRTSYAPAVLCALALAGSAALGFVWLHKDPSAGFVPSIADDATSSPVTLARASSAAPRSASVSAAPPARRNGSLLDPGFTAGSLPVTFARSAPLRASFEPQSQPDVAQAVALAEIPALQDDPAVEPQVDPALPIAPALANAVPLPAPRPSFDAAAPAVPPRVPGSRRVASLPSAPEPVAPAATPAAPADHPGFFERLFGSSEQRGPALAYASPDIGGLGNILSGRMNGYDRWTAVYDISSHTVFLPDGTRLEAHSGLGSSYDNPRSVAEHMRGATPPNMYELSLRESLFHGVQALRLTPVGEAPTYGRGGLLAHTFMLGPRGDSNGCVVFRNYRAFLAAYESGQIRHLAVVARLN